MFDQCLYFNTTALARVVEREWTRTFEPFGLTPPQAFMLRAILARPGALHRELAEILGIARPTATRVLDSLAGKGLIERHPSGIDGRESCVHPTAAAKTIERSLTAASAATTRRIKGLIGAETFERTVAQLREIRATLG
jgi:MarR family transcriptional regulator, organic hydroperoxide resistance regulator